MNVRFVDVDPCSETALALLRKGAVEARALYADVAAPDAPWPTNAANGPRDVYVVAYLDHDPVACGALRDLDGRCAEVRRVYVVRQHRRHNIGRAMLSHLAAEARRLGYERLRLETGLRQAPALALYERFGFYRIAPFGKYIDDPSSVCFEFTLEKEQP
jgi:putative acetyltransferase